MVVSTIARPWVMVRERLARAVEHLRVPGRTTDATPFSSVPDAVLDRIRREAL